MSGLVRRRRDRRLCNAPPPGAEGGYRHLWPCWQGPQRLLDKIGIKHVPAPRRDDEGLARGCREGHLGLWRWNSLAATTGRRTATVTWRVRPLQAAVRATGRAPPPLAPTWRTARC